MTARRPMPSRNSSSASSACSAAQPANVAIRIIRNAENVGNCLSRNAGIAACAADIYIVIDSDCLINKDFVSAHVAEHRLPDTDAVVGPYNIETNGEDGLALLQRLEQEPNQVLPRSTMQDELLETAFVNTVTRNFSINKRWLDTHGDFDPMLSYSRKPDSGYGWEDVDIGARIYAAKGASATRRRRSRSTCRMKARSPADGKVKGSAQNFHYLVAKHPFIRTAARRWYVDTADRIVAWADEIGATSPALEFLRNDIREPKRAIAPLIPYLRKQKRRYRILTHRWHVPHQCEIYKLPFDFTLLTGTGTGFTNAWGYDQRPLRRECPPGPGRERGSIRLRHGDRPFRRECALSRSEQRRARRGLGRYVPLVHGERQAADGRRCATARCRSSASMGPMPIPSTASSSIRRTRTSCAARSRTSMSW